jgi:hypothetical protein
MREGWGTRKFEFKDKFKGDGWRSEDRRYERREDAAAMLRTSSNTNDIT